MRRLALTLALAATLALSACGHDDQSVTDTAATTPDPSRFKSTWMQFLPLTHTPASSWQFTDADLLRFADMADRPDADNGGRWCLQSQYDTYLAMTHSDSVVLMGDGPCSYEAADAKVTANFITGEWTRGADLMGEITDAKMPH